MTKLEPKIELTPDQINCLIMSAVFKKVDLYDLMAMLHGFMDPETIMSRYFEMKRELCPRKSLS